MWTSATSFWRRIRAVSAYGFYIRIIRIIGNITECTDRKDKAHEQYYFFHLIFPDCQYLSVISHIHIVRCQTRSGHPDTSFLYYTLFITAHLYIAEPFRRYDGNRSRFIHFPEQCHCMQQTSHFFIKSLLCINLYTVSNTNDYYATSLPCLIMIFIPRRIFSSWYDLFTA